MFSRIVPTIMAAAALTGALPAAAATAQLAWKDLDLASDAGRAELARRITATARQACKAMVSGSRIPRTTPDCLADARLQMTTQLAARAPQGPALAATEGGPSGSR